MNLHLSPEIQKWVEDRISEGQYASAEEVVEAGIARLMLDPEPHVDEETLHAIEEGDADADGDRGDIAWEDLKTQLLGKYR